MAIQKKGNIKKLNYCPNCFSLIQWTNSEDEETVFGNKKVVCPQCGKLINAKEAEIKTENSGEGGNFYIVSQLPQAGEEGSYYILKQKKYNIYYYNNMISKFQIRPLFNQIFLDSNYDFNNISDYSTFEAGTYIIEKENTIEFFVITANKTLSMHEEAIVVLELPETPINSQQMYAIKKEKETIYNYEQNHFNKINSTIDLTLTYGGEYTFSVSFPSYGVKQINSKQEKIINSAILLTGDRQDFGDHFYEIPIGNAEGVIIQTYSKLKQFFPQDAVTALEESGQYFITKDCLLNFDDN